MWFSHMQFGSYQNLKSVYNQISSEKMHFGLLLGYTFICVLKIILVANSFWIQILILYLIHRSFTHSYRQLHTHIKLYTLRKPGESYIYTLELSFRVTRVGLRGLQRNRRHTRSKWNHCKSRLLLPLFSHSVVNLGVPLPPIQSRVCSLSQ